MKYIVLLKASSFPYRLYLQTKCSSLDTMEKISAQDWNAVAAEAALFEKEEAVRLAAQANASGAKDCTFEVFPPN